MSKYHGFYETLAKYYDLGYGRMLEHGLKLGVHAMDPRPGENVLEVGMGTGLSLNFFPGGIQIVGIDLSPNMLEQARKRATALKMDNVDLKVMSAEDLKVDDNSYDCVFCPSVLSVVGHPEKALAEMIRVCKPGGRICIISHFQGQSSFERTLDKVFNPVTNRFLGFRMTTPRDFIEHAKGVKIAIKKNIFFWNFSTLYLMIKD